MLCKALGAGDSPLVIMRSRAVFRLIVSSAAAHVRRTTFFAAQRLAQRMVALVWNGTRKTSVGCLARLEAWPGFASLSIFWQVARCLLVHFSISSREIVKEMGYQTNYARF